MIRIFMNGYSHNKGGVEAYISNLCGCLDSNTFEIIYSLPEMEIDGEIWKAPPNRHRYFKYRKFWIDFFKENHFDVLYDNECDIVSIDKLRFAKKAGVPIRILHSHSSANQQRVNLFHKIGEKLNRSSLDKYVTHFFACSENAGEWMFSDRDFVIIKNGILLNEYQYSEENDNKNRKELNISERKVIGCVGRLEKVKNLDFALNIISSLPDNYIVVVVGSGSELYHLKKIVNQLDIGERVMLLGQKDNINELMSMFDCLLMPSLFEGLPFVLVEAQAAGLPCVVSSTVSQEADITGLVKFIDLDAPKKVWADAIMLACEQDRIDTREQMIKAGYSIEDSARTVEKLILNR